MSLHSWFVVTIVCGVLLAATMLAFFLFLTWSTKQLLGSMEKNRKSIDLRRPKDRFVMRKKPKLHKLGTDGTVSSTSSVHPTRETWLDMPGTSTGTRQSTSSAFTVRRTAKDLEEMFKTKERSDSAMAQEAEPSKLNKHTKKVKESSA